MWHGFSCGPFEILGFSWVLLGGGLGVFSEVPWLSLGALRVFLGVPGCFPVGPLRAFVGPWDYLGALGASGASGRPWGSRGASLEGGVCGDSLRRFSVSCDSFADVHSIYIHLCNINVCIYV